MADITMCEGKGCIVKNNCYRFKAPINEYRQAYFAEQPGKDKSCNYYWKL